MAQEQKKTNPETEAETEEVEAVAGSEVDGNDIDELLDAIDEVLEEDAETFTAQFIQKGGE